MGQYEVDVVGHGPHGDRLTHHIAEQITIWDLRYRTRRVQIDVAAAEARESVSGLFIFDRPATRLALSWT